MPTKSQVYGRACGALFPKGGPRTSAERALAEGLRKLSAANLEALVELVEVRRSESFVDLFRYIRRLVTDYNVGDRPMSPPAALLKVYRRAEELRGK